MKFIATTVEGCDPERCGTTRLSHEVRNFYPAAGATMLAWCETHHRLVAFEFRGHFFPAVEGFPCRRCGDWLSGPGVCGTCGAD